MGYMRWKIDKKRSKKLFSRTAGMNHSNPRNGSFPSTNPSLARGGHRM